MAWQSGRDQRSEGIFEPGLGKLSLGGYFDEIVTTSHVCVCLLCVVSRCVLFVIYCTSCLLVHAGAMLSALCCAVLLSVSLSL